MLESNVVGGFFHKPSFTWSDGDACGLQIFELLGRGAAHLP